jgi:hypothetical protein
MAIFLLIYILLIIVWLSWSGTITYILLKYRYPDNIGLIRLGIYWAVCILFLLVSLVFIVGADWVTVPDVFNAIGI